MLPKLDESQIRQLINDLATENERLEVVLDSLNHGLLVCDDAHVVFFYNKCIDRLIPLSGGDLYEKTAWEAVADEEIASFLQRTLENQESVSDEEFTLEQGGMTRILWISVMPLVRAGSIQGNIVHVEDVTEQRNREARLRRAESLASLTTLAAGVAHEIKNPLGSIGIHLQLVDKTLSKSSQVSSDDVRSYLDVINEEVDRLNRIVVDFLFAVRPIDVSLEERELNPIIKDLAEFTQYEIEEAGIELVLELEESLPALQLDERYFKQALLNIVKNAIPAMPDGGQLIIRTLRRGDEVEVQVKDTGVGMDEETMQKVFEPYFTTKESGSGIGLTLVYKIIKEHLGEVSVSSREGVGTTFTITLPVPQRETRLLSYEGDAT